MGEIIVNVALENYVDLVLEELDLLADCQRGVLAPRPESPIFPLLRLK